ncbi:MAG: hypothetical protein RAO92_09010 [Candidatus Euphemobacter frigidus]|nr:hypothetical protein [Candidatus Euphemobacter frigidus]MDP8276526.1 hypothetical protein [Candidatus Euphemobacter frigidus]
MKDKFCNFIGRGGPIILALLLLAVAVVVIGCASTEGGSSIPWAEPEPWEQQPSFGVPY